MVERYPCTNRSPQRCRYGSVEDYIRIFPLDVGQTSLSSSSLAVGSISAKSCESRAIRSGSAEYALGGSHPFVASPSSSFSPVLTKLRAKSMVKYIKRFPLRLFSPRAEQTSDPKRILVSCSIRLK